VFMFLIAIKALSYLVLLRV